MLGGHGAKGASFRGVEDEAEEIFLNLTPMIDVLTCLLFFLLLSFGAVIIALINASVPVIADGEPDPTVSQDKITVGLSITHKGMLVTASHDKMTEAELGKLKKFFPKKGKDQDYKGLHEYLYGVKRRYPRSSSIVITPASGITYEELIQAMDASRDREMMRGKRPYKLPLFPEAVVSTLVE